MPFDATGRLATAIPFAFEGYRIALSVVESTLLTQVMLTNRGLE